MARLFISPSLTLPVGTTLFGPFTPPSGLSVVTAAIDRTFLTSPTLRISWLVEISFDAGVTWLSVAGAGTIGGVLAENFSLFTVRLNRVTDATTRLRGSVTTNEVATVVVTVDGT